MDDKENGLHKLEEENAKLREELSKSNTQHQNYSIKYILNLQKSLENYIIHLESNIDINTKEVYIFTYEYKNASVRTNQHKVEHKNIQVRLSKTSCLF